MATTQALKKRLAEVTAHHFDEYFAVSLCI